MYVSSIFLDRFGRRADVKINNLSNGLNVVCGPVGSGKSTLVDFLRAIWNGFNARLRRQYLPGESRGFGGAIAVQTSYGQQMISRYDDGSPDGRLTLEREDGAVIGRSHVHDLIGDVSAQLLERAFLVNFLHLPRLEELLRAASTSGYGLSGKPETANQLRDVDRLLAEKRAHLEKLSNPKKPKGRRRRLRGAEIAAPSADSETTQIFHPLPEPVAELIRREATITAELATLDQQWNELDTQRQHQEMRPESTSQSAHEESTQLRMMDVQLARWNRTLRDIVSRRQRAAERSDNRQQAVAVAASNATPQRHLTALKMRIQQFQHSLEQISAQPRECNCQQLRTAFTDVLHAMQDDVEQLDNDLNYWHAYHLYRQASGERDQLARCELELRQTIQSLVERRQAMLCRLVDAKSSTSTEQSYKQLAEHQTENHEVASASESSNEHGLAELNRELVRIDELRHKARRELQQIAQELAKFRCEIPNSTTPARRLAIAEVGPRDTVERERSERNDERRQKLVREIGKLEQDARRLRSEVNGSNIVQEASQYLRRLSSSKWIEIHAASVDRISIEDAHGCHVQYDDLDAGSRDQVYLAFCLAIVAAFDRSGVRIPLVLNAAFTHYPSRDVRDALEVLRDFARERQIICLTRYTHVVGLARMLNVPVQQLSNSENAESHPGPKVVISEPREPGSRNSPMDAEEFPIDRSGRVRRKAATSSEKFVRKQLIEEVTESPSTATSKQSAAEFYLSEYDPIERAPSIDQSNANRLRRIGILRVGDVLRVPIDEITADLRQFGVTSEMIISWQRQIRLMCQVRGLRSYDSRVLVACGITGPEQLLEMSASAFRNRVREFSVTAEGQAILLSGTQAELSRVTEWIQGSRNWIPEMRQTRSRTAA